MEKAEVWVSGDFDLNLSSAIYQLLELSEP